jgi:hypothetical protein
MLVDKRIVSKFLPPNLFVQEQEEVPFIKGGINCAVNVLLHRSYLYLVNPKHRHACVLQKATVTVSSFRKTTL